METDGTYDHDIQIPLTFTYGAIQECMCNYHFYNGPGPAIRDYALNRFKVSLEACTLAGDLDCELIPHLTFHSNYYAYLKLGNHAKFIGYKW